jgi:uncharacterized membrane protein YbhN (UPF0104 family)
VQLSTKQRGALKLGLTLVTALGLFLLLRGRRDFSLAALLDAFTRFSPLKALLVVGLGLVQVGTMILRAYAVGPWRPHIELRVVATAIAVAHAANMFLPARAGEALKAIWLGRAGGNDSGYLARGAGWLMADKAIDLTTFFTLLLATGVLGLPAFERSVSFSLWWIPIGIAAIFALTGLAALVSKRAKDKIRLWSTRLGEGLSGLKDPKKALLGLTFGFGNWAAELAALSLLVSSQGYSLGIAELFFILVVLNLAIAIPISMANVGTFEASVAFALELFGVPVATGLAIGGAHHLLQLVGVAGWGLTALAWSRAKPGILWPVPSTASGPSA